MDVGIARTGHEHRPCLPIPRLQFLGHGILGLGFKETSALGADSFFGTLVSQGGPTDGESVFWAPFG
jgi:hypothetical protein